MLNIQWASIARVCVTTLRAPRAYVHPATLASATDILMEIAQQLDDLETRAKKVASDA